MVLVHWMWSCVLEQNTTVPGAHGGVKQLSLWLAESTTWSRKIYHLPETSLL